jgi:hypothetical protein
MTAANCNVILLLRVDSVTGPVRSDKGMTAEDPPRGYRLVSPKAARMRGPSAQDGYFPSWYSATPPPLLQGSTQATHFIEHARDASVNIHVAVPTSSHGAYISN